MYHYGSQRSSQEQQKERGKTLKSNVKAVLLMHLSPGKWTVYSSIIKESSTDYKKTASYRQTQY